MYDLTSHKVTRGVHCSNVRHKGMYVLAIQDPSEDRFYDRYDSGAFWCAQTLTGFGPDGHPVRPDICQGDRPCCKP
jgi:hypothetical protein